MQNSGSPTKKSDRIPNINGSGLKAKEDKVAIARAREAQAKTKPPRSPTTTPPERPQGATRGGGASRLGESLKTMLQGATRERGAGGQRSPPAPAAVDRGGPRLLVFGPPDASPMPMVSRYSEEAEGFAGEILIALHCPFGARTRAYARERANVAAAWDQAVSSGLSFAQLCEVRDKGRRDAAGIGRGRDRYYRRLADGTRGSPERYWRFRWNLHVDARRPVCSRARDGPA